MIRINKKNFNNMMNVSILGFGQEGKAVLKYLKKTPQFKKVSISILDKKLNKNYLKNLHEFDIIFRSPGIPYNLPAIQNAIKKGVEISSSTKIFFSEANKIGCKIIGITGTKGKGTTSTLLYKILKAANKDVYLAGNIGKPAIELLPKIKRNSIIILELSSFQLQDLKQSPQIAVILDVFQDHLDSHKNFKEYVESKANIAKWQKKSDKIFYDANNKWSRWIAQKSPGSKTPCVYYGAGRGKRIFIGEILFSNSREWFHKLKSIVKIPGEHNLKNAAMAIAVAKSLNIPGKSILKTVKNFHGLEHRLELARDIKISNQSRKLFANIHEFNSRKISEIKFYNDSASTNPFTAIAAIKSFNEPKILICGGKDKNLDYSPLAKTLKNSNTKLVVLFGENKNKIKQSITESGIPIKLTKNLESAIALSYKSAQKLINQLNNQPITIIFSPASASFDMFSNYKERGEKFKEIVLKLK